MLSWTGESCQSCCDSDRETGGLVLTSTMQSDYSTTSEGACSQEEKRTAHGTQAAGYLGVEAVDIKATIDFFFSLSVIFTSHLTSWFCSGFV